MADDGLTFEPSTQAFLDAAAESEFIDPRTDGIEGFRRTARQLQLTHTPDVPAGVKIEDITVPGRNSNIPCRVYRPSKITAPEAPNIVCYLHGGGWVIGGLDEYDGVCGYLSEHSGSIVVSVDYRLAPEHPFPAPLEDCIDAVTWVAKSAASISGSPSARVSVAGDSAGGNLAAIVSQKLKAHDDVTLDLQILLCPCIAPHDPVTYPSQLIYGGVENFLNNEMYAYFVASYLGTFQDQTDDRIWPITTSNLTGLPDAYIVVAEYDLLRDEAIAYAEALKATNNQATLIPYGKTIHAFINFSKTITLGLTALDDLCSFLQFRSETSES